MSRKKFIEKHGATCNNWRNSWSFVNNEERFVIFGAFNHITEENKTLIFSTRWKFMKGRKQGAYDFSYNNIRLIIENGYQLKIFYQIYSDENLDSSGEGPAAIKSFIPNLYARELEEINGDYYAVKKVLYHPNEILDTENYIEGSVSTVRVNTYERSREAREKCLREHGYKCFCCDFDFEETYGKLGEKYIHVHHKIPLASIKKEYTVDPIKDLVPLCPNCHSMIHKPKEMLTVDELKSIISLNKKH